MPKEQQRKIKGAICNVPVECDQTCNQLPRAPERSGIIMLKLKLISQFRGHVYFQAVRPEVLQLALYWLKENNSLYKDIIVDINNIDNSFTILQHNDASEALICSNIITIDGDPTLHCNISEGNQLLTEDKVEESDNEEDDDPLN